MVPMSGVGRALGRLKMKHEKGVGCFMVPMSGAGPGRLKMEHEKGGWVLHASHE